MREFYLILRGFEKKVDIIDVLAKTWVGSLRYREVELICRVFPSFPFCNEAFIAYVGVESSGNKFREEEFVEDSREGVLSILNKHKASWQSSGGHDVENLALVRRLRMQKVFRWSLHLEIFEMEVINSLDDGNGDKYVVHELYASANLVDSKPGVVLETSERLNVVMVGVV
ncbi:unnamed protein product [Lactuca virosa]|uniref:FBD domain-containing protein n=1 Tax=Lactuca virosa TaxID=75947 RepID=A0AAU9NJD0_9ASTR|nr:unnamed protein product [Lactuca virosa]